MPKPNAFDVIKTMSLRNLDVRATNTVVNAQTVKAGGHVTFGVDTGTVNAVLNDMLGVTKSKYRVFMMVVNSEQFNEVEKELSGTKTDNT